MNYSILSSMIQSGINGAKKAKSISRGGASSTNTEGSAKPKTHILRIGVHVDRHNRWLDRRLRGVKKDDLVVLEYGGNYCNFDWAAISSNPDIDHRPLLSFGQFREFYANAITKCQAIGARVALLTLPTQQRIAFNMRYYDEMTYEEIAAVTGKNVGTLKTNYHYASEKIRKYIKDHSL